MNGRAWAIVVFLVAGNVFQQLTIYYYRSLFARYDGAVEQYHEQILKANQQLKETSDLLKACHCKILPSEAKDSASSIIHVPPNGQCPAGDTRRKDFFDEKDGKHQDACENPKGDGSIDMFMPGEGMHITIEIPAPGREKPKGKDGKS